MQIFKINGNADLFGLELKGLYDIVLKTVICLEKIIKDNILFTIK